MYVGTFIWSLVRFFEELLSKIYCARSQPIVKEAFEKNILFGITKIIRK
jgi:hypothetical protein